MSDFERRDGRRDGGRRDGGRRDGGGRDGGGFRRDSGPREVHKTKCSECGKDCEVPFKPAQDRPVYCKECFMKKKSY
ncbi:MAG: CxxC-x17-CxxC domain-containing protein [Candidatus Aenigmatarchaeota archaeon]